MGNLFLQLLPWATGPLTHGPGLEGMPRPPGRGKVLGLFRGDGGPFGKKKKKLVFGHRGPRPGGFPHRFLFPKATTRPGLFCQKHKTFRGGPALFLGSRLLLCTGLTGGHRATYPAGIGGWAGKTRIGDEKRKPWFMRGGTWPGSRGLGSGQGDRLGFLLDQKTTSGKIGRPSRALIGRGSALDSYIRRVSAFGPAGSGRLVRGPTARGPPSRSAGPGEGTPGDVQSRVPPITACNCGGYMGTAGPSGWKRGHRRLGNKLQGPARASCWWVADRSPQA